jgi:FkbM family methyltransferase
MNVFQRILRHSYVPYYAAKLLWETLRAWGIGRWLSFWMSSEDAVPLTMNGLNFKVRASSIKSKMTDTFAIMETVHHRLYNRKFFDDEFQIGPEDTVVDIGGYVGSFAIPAAQIASRGRVFSYEPSPENFAQFQLNLSLNDLKNVQVFNAGVASSDRTITLFLDHMNPASNSIYLRSDQGKSDRCVEREAISLQTLFSRHGIDRCDFLKVDCEGAEYEILMTLGRPMLDRIGKIACELHEPVYYGVSNPDHTPEKLVRFLEENGFTVYRRPVNPYLGMLYAANHSFPKRPPA